MSHTTYPTGDSTFGLLAMNSSATAALGAAALDSVGVAANERKAEQKRMLSDHYSYTPVSALSSVPKTSQQRSSHVGNTSNKSSKSSRRKIVSFKESNCKDNHSNDIGEKKQVKSALSSGGRAGGMRRTNEAQKPILRRDSLTETESGSDVVFLVGQEPDVQRISAHSWILAESSPVFRAMFKGPMASRDPMMMVTTADAKGAHAHTCLASGPSSSSSTKRALPLPKATIAVSDVDGRAFDILLRYLYNETVTLHSVMTALTTLYAAHKYMCPGLARTAVKYLKENLTEKNVLLILQHITLYCNGQNDSATWDAPVVTQPPPIDAARKRPSAPPLSALEEAHDKVDTVNDDEDEGEPLLLGHNQVTEDDFRDFEVGMTVTRAIDPVTGQRRKINCCAGLLRDCLDLIDRHATTVLTENEDIEDVDVNALKSIVCRETLGVTSEVDVFIALMRWSSRECKRQKLEVNLTSRRQVLEGAQFLVRYLTLSPEDFSKASGLLTDEEKDALLSVILSKAECSAADVVLPDHLSECVSIMRTRRRGPSQVNAKGTKPKGKSLRLTSKKTKVKGGEEERKAATSTVAKDRLKVQELKERNKEKFNIIEEFFICLACIFD